MWLVTRYEVVLAVFKDKRFIKDFHNALTKDQLAGLPPIPEAPRPLTRNMLVMDPPDHARLRALVQKAFTPRLIERMRPRIQAIADELLDAVEGRGEMYLIDSNPYEICGPPAESRRACRPLMLLSRYPRGSRHG